MVDLRARVFLVEDHPLVREGLSLRIASQPDLEVSGEAATESEALARLKNAETDVVVVDIALKSGHGLDLIKQLRARYPSLRMLVVSGFPDSLYAERALRAGALGYLNKQESNEKVIAAIRAVARGERYVSPEITRRLLNVALGEAPRGDSPQDLLSDRELEVFRLIGEGLTSAAIARRLFLSKHTVDSHRENIKRKLGLNNANELTRTAVQWMLEGGDRA